MYYISYSISIEESNNSSEILMKLILASIYNINLEDMDIDCINKVAKIYCKVFKSLVLQLQHLQSKKT